MRRRSAGSTRSIQERGRESPARGVAVANGKDKKVTGDRLGRKKVHHCHRSEASQEPAE